MWILTISNLYTNSLLVVRRIYMYGKHKNKVFQVTYLFWHKMLPNNSFKFLIYLSLELCKMSLFNKNTVRTNFLQKGISYNSAKLRSDVISKSSFTELPRHRAVTIFFLWWMLHFFHIMLEMVGWLFFTVNLIISGSKPKLFTYKITQNNPIYHMNQIMLFIY